MIRIVRIVEPSTGTYPYKQGNKNNSFFNSQPCLIRGGEAK